MSDPFAIEYVAPSSPFSTFSRLLPLWFIPCACASRDGDELMAAQHAGMYELAHTPARIIKDINKSLSSSHFAFSYLHLPLQVKRNDLMRSPVTAGNGVGGWVRRLFPSASGGCEGLMWVIETSSVWVCSSDRQWPVVLSSPRSQEAHIYTKHTPHFSGMNLAAKLVLSLFEL